MRNVYRRVTSQLACIRHKGNMSTSGRKLCLHESRSGKPRDHFYQHKLSPANESYPFSRISLPPDVCLREIDHSCDGSDSGPLNGGLHVLSLLGVYWCPTGPVGRFYQISSNRRGRGSPLGAHLKFFEADFDTQLSYTPMPVTQRLSWSESRQCETCRAFEGTLTPRAGNLPPRSDNSVSDYGYVEPLPVNL